jgi:hypothetical protein
MLWEGRRETALATYGASCSPKAAANYRRLRGTLRDFGSYF